MSTPNVIWSKEQLRPLVTPQISDHIETNDNNEGNDNSSNNDKRKWKQSRDYNKNLLYDTSNSWSHISVKNRHLFCKQLFMSRKTFLALLFLALIGFYINSTLQDDDRNTLVIGPYVPVLHQSHVLGMKDSIMPASPPINLFKPSTTNHLNVSSVLAVLSTKLATSEIGSIFTQTNISYAANNNATDHFLSTIPKKGYLVWSEQCKIQNVDPYLQEVMKFFHRLKYKTCTKQKPLTYVRYDEIESRYVLIIDQSVVKDYVDGRSYYCCYNSIERYDEMKIKLSDCIKFVEQIQLAPSIDSVIVKCYTKKHNIYINGHALVPERPEVRARFEEWRQRKQMAKQKQVPNVLIIGIDSVSRVNLIRAMPKTAQYLYDNEWFEMAGYNKVDDNTFPNLMALLAGFNKTNALNKCKPRDTGGLDNCTFLWNLYRDHGYVTAFAEDAVSINTFNYLKKGFQAPPVDYYLRPFLLAAEEHLKVTCRAGLVSCLGYKHAAEHIYDYALEFASRYHNDQYFGFFWTNTFSHNDISECTAMDERIVDYLERFNSLGTFNNSIVIFLSDHGIRFGPTRKTWSGHMEERLPFMFVWLPPYLKQQFPDFVNALNVNKNRLTNPYDLHITLKHVLTLSERVNDKHEFLKPLSDCPHCQSLLVTVSHNRSCESIAIEDHWCTCIPYNNVYKNSKTVQKLAHRIIIYINDYVAKFQNGTFAKRCRPLGLLNIASAYRAHHNTGNHFVETYRIMFYTKPNKGLFEATVRYKESDDSVVITGEISRLNMYIGEADCMDDFGVKKYCVCNNWRH